MFNVRLSEGRDRRVLTVRMVSTRLSLPSDTFYAGKKPGARCASPSVIISNT